MQRNSLYARRGGQPVGGHDAGSPSNLPHGRSVDDPPAISKSEALQFLRRFGERRGADGDEFLESELLPGHFLYCTGEAHAGVVIWGDEDRWTFSTFAAARVNMRPTIELYRYVGRWRSSCGLGAPYVIEDGGAAVMCETTLGGNQLYAESTGWRMLVSSIDLVAEAARVLSVDLSQADGVAFTARGEAGLTLLTGWWEVNDPRVTQLMGLS
jgi:hypothetical protein